MYELVAALGIFYIILILILLACVVLYVIRRWNLFKKAGKKDWETIISFYNDSVYVEISDLNW